jgi:hypothetical protein
MITLEKHSDGSVHLSGLGLKLEIDPKWLFKQSINQESQIILDKLLENELKSALDEFIDSDENVEKIRRRLYHKEMHSALIAKIANIERDLVNKIHSDPETIELSDAQSEARDFAYSVWKYCSDYGFARTSKTVLDSESKTA